MGGAVSGGQEQLSSYDDGIGEEELEMAMVKAKEIAGSNPVAVFGKSYCAYCKRVTQLLTELKAIHMVYQLDAESDGAAIHSALKVWTKQRTVPNIFIGGKHIGGCDDIMERHNQGILREALIEAGSLSRGKPKLREDIEIAIAKAKTVVHNNPVVVFCQSCCPYCTRVKQLLTQLKASYKVVELDIESDGFETLAALQEWTGQKTVPNVFIAGKHIGGHDDVMARHNEGTLVPLLAEARALVA